MPEIVPKVARAVVDRHPSCWTLEGLEQGEFYPTTTTQCGTLYGWLKLGFFLVRDRLSFRGQELDHTRCGIWRMRVSDDMNLMRESEGDK